MSMDQPTSPRPQSNRSRGFSFHSQNSGSKKDIESPEEKKRRDSLYKGGSKANPNAALIEAQPGAANMLEDTTLQNLRAMEHLDVNGNPIVDPDLSNPTRPRFERPLDTIRSFEKAINNGYKRGSSYQRSASTYDANNQYASQRTSFYGGNGNGGQGPPAPQHVGGGYYGSQQRDSYYGTGNSQRPRGYSGRMQSEPNMNGGRPYNQPQHGYHQSHDTVNTGYTNGSDSTGPWANSTDPGSENSSIDRNLAMNNGGQGKQQAPDGYGYNETIMEEQGGYGQDGYGQPQMGQRSGGYGGGGPVQQPPPTARRPIPLGSSGPGAEMYQGGSLPSNTRAGASQKDEKRKSWLKRRFSKKE